MLSDKDLRMTEGLQKTIETENDDKRTKPKIDRCRNISR